MIESRLALQQSRLLALVAVKARVGCLRDRGLAKYAHPRLARGSRLACRTAAGDAALSLVRESG